jgi:hypothetical protein
LEVSFVDEVPASVGERALLPALGDEIVSECGLHEDELSGHAAYLHKEPAALWFLEVPVEETREDAVEGGIWEGECRGISADEGGCEKSPPGDPEHSLALVETHDLALQVASHIQSRRRHRESVPTEATR